MSVALSWGPDMLPDLAVANELYCLCLNLSRLHPEDFDLLEDVDTAWAVLVDAFVRHNGGRSCLTHRELGDGEVVLVLEPWAYEKYGYRVSS